MYVLKLGIIFISLMELNSGIFVLLSFSVPILVLLQLSQGDIYDHESLLRAIKQVDIVISTVGTQQLADQVRIIEAIKEAGNVKASCFSFFTFISFSAFSVLLFLRLKKQESLIVTIKWWVSRDSFHQSLAWMQTVSVQ